MPARRARSAGVTTTAACIAQARHHRVDERVTCDEMQSMPTLEQHLEARAEAGEVLIRQRADLEAARVVAPREIVVDEPVEIARPAHRQPADFARLERRHEIAAYVREAGAPGREQPLLPSAGEDVDVTPVHIEREHAHALDRVDDEIDAPLPTGTAQALEVEGEPRRERHPREVSTLTRGRSSAARIASSSGSPVDVHGMRSYVIPSRAERHPGIHVRRELAVG